MILSICIPTYNRVRFLDALLGLLTAKFAESDLNSKVEILVSDNASTDNTSEVLEKYRGIISYWKNDENIGPDANFLKLFSEASGRYIWLPGDDDLVRVDTLNYILRMISEYSFDYLYLRTRGIVKKNWRERNAIEMTNIQFLRRVNIHTTFMTSQVIRADLIKPNIAAARVHLGGFMAYYWIYLEALYKSKCCLVSDEKEVYPDATENTGGYRFYKVWAEAVFDVIKKSSINRDEKFFSIMRQRMFLVLLLPVTYRLRSGSAGFKFQNENPALALRKYFGKGFYGVMTYVYTNLPYIFLKPVNLVMRLFARIVRLIRDDIV